MEEGIKEIARKWVHKAENDLKTAAQILKTEEVITDTLCFHCQQAAEKYLKAFLVSHNTVPEKTHKIERLLEACRQIEGTFDELKDAVLLSEYAVELRYIDDFYKACEKPFACGHRNSPPSPSLKKRGECTTGAGDLEEFSPKYSW